MKPIQINLRELSNAMEDGNGFEVEWWLDRRTGDVFPIFGDEFDVPEEQEEVVKQMHKDPDRYLLVPQFDSSIGFRFMEDFNLSLPEGEARRSLERALRLPKPFRSFKDTLLDFGDMRERWFAYHDERLDQVAREFLDREKIEYEAKP